MGNSMMERLVAAMYRAGGESLVVEADKPARIKVGGREAPLLAQALKLSKVEEILREVMPSDFAWVLQRNGEVVFPLQCAAGAVSVRVQHRNAWLAAFVQPQARDLPRVRSVMPAMEPHVPPAPLPLPEAPALQVLPYATVVGLPLAAVDKPEGAPQAPAASAVAAAPTQQPATPPRPRVSQLVGYYHAVQEPVVTPREPPPAPPPPPEPPVLMPVVDMVHGIDPILAAVYGAGGSDLHLTAGLRPMMRKDGDMGGIPGFLDVLSGETIQKWLMEVAPEKARGQYTSTHDVDYGYALGDVARFRVNAFQDRRGVCGVLRVIPAQVRTADDLNLPLAIRQMCTLQKGLVVVTGPTGSGKSTTLAAMLDLVNRTRPDHVITIEDPVEFVHESIRCLIHQREVHSDTMSFAAALRAALREDPDVILLGELRDLETVAIAIETAETGHLVFGTLHTNTAVSTVDRIIDQFPADRQNQVRAMLSDSLKGVVAQTLCKKVGGGRVAALEVLVALPSVANLIREGKTFQLPSIMQTGKAQGMQTMNDALLQLVREGQVTPEEAIKRAVHRSELTAMIQNMPTRPHAPGVGPAERGAA